MQRNFKIHDISTIPQKNLDENLVCFHNKFVERGAIDISTT
jgi:hypothetical protein